MSDSTKKGLLLGAGALALLALLALFAGVLGPRPMMYGPGGMMGGGFWSSPWMLIPILLPFGLLALLAWAVASIASGRSGDGEAGRDQAEEILRQRFARGEIDADEYEQAIRTLRGDAPVSNDRAPR